MSAVRLHLSGLPGTSMVGGPPPTHHTDSCMSPGWSVLGPAACLSDHPSSRSWLLHFPCSMDSTALAAIGSKVCRCLHLVMAKHRTASALPLPREVTV